MSGEAPDPVEAAAERAYCAFIESARAFLPSQIPEWGSVSPQVRGAWMAAVVAAAAPPRNPEN